MSQFLIGKVELVAFKALVEQKLHKVSQFLIGKV